MKSSTGKAVCPYCGVGCVIRATVEDNIITKISTDDNDAPNYGMLCPKGAHLKQVFQNHDGRLAYPMIRENKDEELRRVSWEQAIAFTANRLQTIQLKHGKDALALYGSGQLDTETCYVFNKLFKGFLRTNNIDTNSRLCMSSAVVGYIQAFGSDGPPTCYDDIQHADVFLIIGANMAVNHPVLFQMIRKRRASEPNTRIITVDPRRTQTADFSDVHVPLAPGSDVAFLQLIAKRLLANGRVDRRFIQRNTENYSAYKHQLECLKERNLVAISDIHPGRIDEIVEFLSKQDCRLLSFYCQGTNQSTSGVEKNNALINLHLQLGEVGKSGSGPFSLTGQPNAMGGREVGYLSHQLPGYRVVTNDTHRAYLEGAWRIPLGSIAREPGLTAVPMFEAAAAGNVHALWIVCTNPAVSMPDTKVSQAGLKRADLVVVQDCYYPTETSEYADVLLPAAQWGEKSGTMTNSERLVVRSDKFLEPPGEAKPDWWIFSQIAKVLGYKRDFDFHNHEEIWDEYRLLTAGTPCDQMGMTNERLKTTSLRWPCPHPRHPGTLRRYTRRKFFTPSGKAQFKIPIYKPPDEAIDTEFPLGLTTGRVASQWHTRTRTGKVPQLTKKNPEPFVEIHPDDAEEYRVTDGDWIYLVGRRGRCFARARVTDTIRRGLLFTPFHWGDLFHSETNVNYVTNSAFDPVSKQPELKFCAVRIEPDNT
ncbi:nitrate reductase [Candidatus Poribacteria bacterium]|nr:nitrate reductase [Candidatus Poribacteria bacterium]MYF56213.1 nitrate reductase [Candidatus Poribacteria bacterium]MYI94056.1 nitrate reductase [Candidatus Poribacteria bacterium]